MTVDPVVLEIVEGSLAAIEKEVETAIGRTARSPMIRDVPGLVGLVLALPVAALAAWRRGARS